MRYQFIRKERYKNRMTDNNKSIMNTNKNIKESQIDIITIILIILNKAHSDYTLIIAKSDVLLMIPFKVFFRFIK